MPILNLIDSDVVTTNFEFSFFHLNSSKMYARDDLFCFDIFCSDYKHHSCIVKLSSVSMVEEATSLEDALAMIQGRVHAHGTYWSSWSSNWTHRSHRPRAAGRPLRTGTKKRLLREVDWYLKSRILKVLLEIFSNKN